MPASTPVAGGQPIAEVIIQLPGTGGELDVSGLCQDLKWGAQLNGGYTLSVKLLDNNFNILKRLTVESNYFQKSRASIVSVRFRLRWPDLAANRKNETAWQIALITNAAMEGDTADAASMVFEAVDPPSWFLSCGSSFGGVFTGRVSDAIRQCVNKFASAVVLDVTPTTDSAQNKWYMMRLDPKSFIMSLLEWSSSITPKRSQWLVACDGMNLSIKEQLSIPSNNVAFYQGPRRAQPGDSHISAWSMRSDNAFSLYGTKLSVAGLSITTGQYLDRITDADERATVVKDGTTDSKYKAKVSGERAFTKPTEQIGSGTAPPFVGWTHVGSVPEIYSGGELGKPYATYIDGRARKMFLDLQRMVMRTCFHVIGHGIYTSSKGLGVDTITLDWIDADGTPFFLHGNWILDGFLHHFKPGSWVTRVYCNRLDWNANAVPVPSSE